MRAAPSSSLAPPLFTAVTMAAAAPAGKLTVAYWSIRGLGAPLRMMCEYAGADYEVSCSPPSVPHRRAVCLDGRARIGPLQRARRRILAAAAPAD